MTYAEQIRQIRESEDVHWSCARYRVKPLMQRAHMLVSRAVRRGQIPPARQWPCVDCGLQAQHYDHRDYSKPFDVEPVCRSCNYRRGPAEPYRTNH